MRIPLLDLNRQYQVIGDEINQAVLSVLSTHQYILGPEVRELEREVAAYCGSRHAVGCASGSDALLLALMALDIGSKDEVITTPFSFFATAGSIARLGAKPVFVDIDPGAFNIDPAGIEPVITARTRAILPVHLFGQCAEMEPINTTAERHGVAVIEDAAQAIGSQYHGRRAGTLGLMATFSFYPTKNLGGAGDGGMLTTSDEAISRKLISLRGHGATNKYFHEMLGVNSRLDSIQAAILRVKLRYLDGWSEARRHNADGYRAMFSQSGLLDRGLIRLPVDSKNGLHIYNQFVIRAERRDELREFLKEQGVGTEIYYPLPLHLQKCFADLGYKQGQFPAAEAASKESLALPIYPELTLDEMHYVVGAVRSFYLG
ncbi:MAG TPA: DegT/DnrJ/EryC1/StrS family aminotransferase [Blastocatellia bacterium]|nr:DegT/DnrJ/EryC1/StrS family aminotransferase [Blastocatellia bacterium]